MELSDFLATLWGSPPPTGVLNLWQKEGRRTQSFALPDEVAQVAPFVNKLGNPVCELYHQLGLQKDKTGPSSRGTVDTCIAIPGFWMDVDIQGAGHTAGNIPPDQDAAMALLKEFPLTPTMVVHSGGGLHVYWLFTGPWVFDSDSDRNHGQILSRATQAELMRLAQTHGWKLDNTSDLVRILRIPGTFNAKDPNNLCEVRVVSYEPDCRYVPADFEQFVQPVVNASTPATVVNSTVRPRALAKATYPPADGKLVLEHCAWMAHCRDEAASLPEPEWYGMLSIVAACENGHDLAHALSRPHSGYSPTKTDNKFEHARLTAGPRTCENIRTHLNGAAYCGTCVFANFVTSPIVLGSNPERTKALLDVATSLEAVQADPARAFDDAFVAAMALMSRQDPTLFSKVRAVLVGVGVHVRRLDQAIQALTASVSPYLIQTGELYYDRGNGITAKIANFVAEIVEEETHDDGVKVDRFYRIKGTAANGSPLGEVSVNVGEFQAMAWVGQTLGHKAIITPHSQAHVAAAIQYLSLNKEVPSRTVFKHTGWRKIDGTWKFLTTSGALGANGLDPSVVVEVGSFASAYALPNTPAVDAQFKNDMAVAEGLLNLLPMSMAHALFSAVFRAPLAQAHPVDFSLFLEGKTGTFKSECAAMMLGFFGDRFSGKTLPGSWTSTENALGRQAFELKDLLFVVDDFNPVGSVQDVNSWNKKADRVLRAQGNLAGRSRMTAGGQLRPETPPRGMIVATGEDLPRGASLLARLVILQLKPGEINGDVLTKLQTHRSQGGLARVMAAYIQWLAPQIDALRLTLPARFQQLRLEAADRIKAHSRTPDNIANLALGYDLYLQFAVAVGFISSFEQPARWQQGWEALLALGGAQGGDLQDEDPVDRFGELLQSAIIGGQAHLTDRKGAMPPAPETQGWHNVGYPANDIWQPQGILAGYISGNDLYLVTNNAFSAVQRIAQQQGGSFTLSPAGLVRRLVDAGKIKSHEPKLHTIRIKVGTMRVRTIHVDASYLGIGATATQETVQAVPFVPPFGSPRVVHEYPFGSDPFDDELHASSGEGLQNVEEARRRAEEESGEIFG